MKRAGPPWLLTALVALACLAVVVAVLVLMALTDPFPAGGA